MKFLLAFLMAIGCTQSTAWGETILVGDAVKINPYYASLPATCTPGDTINVSGALNFCGTANTWTTLGSGTSGGSGSVQSVSVATANGLSGTVANPTTNPVITLGTPVAGILYGNSGGIFAAVAGNFPTLNQDTTGNAASATNLSGGAIGNVPYQSAPGVTAFLANGAAGTVLQSNGVGADPSWTASVSGTVTSVDVQDASTAPIFVSSGGPVTSSGTIDLTLAVQLSNAVLAGPASGASAQPTFRPLVTADLPSGVGTVSSVDVQDTSTVPLFVSSGGPITTSGVIDLTLASGAGNLVLATPDGAAGQPVLRALVPADVPGGTGTPNFFAAYDGSGNLGIAPAWQLDSTTGEAQSFLTGAGAANVTHLQLGSNINTPLSGGYEGVIVSPQLQSTMNFTSMFNAETDFQSGFNNAGGTGIFQDQSNLEVGASTNGWDSYAAFTSLQGTVTNGINMFLDSPTIASTLSYMGFEGFNEAAQFNAAPSSGGINAFTASQDFHTSFGTAAIGITAFNDFTRLETGVNINNYQSAQFNPNLDAGSTVANVIGYNWGANLNGAVTGGVQGVNISPQGTGAINNITGININLSNISTGANQKMGINVNDGALNVDSNWDTSVLGATPGEFQLNDVGGNLTVASGSPMSNSFGFGVNLASNITLHDNIGVDPTGLGLGYAMVGFVGQVEADLGKTADTVNMAVGGAGVPVSAGDGGTFTNASMFKAIGFLNEGGNLNVTNMYGFQVSPNLSSYATNTWGFWNGDVTADNWFSKNVIIGGVTGKSAGGYQLDVTGNSSLDGYLDQDAIVAPGVSNAGQGRIYFDSSTDIFMASENGGAFVPLIGGGVSSGVSVVSVVTTNGFSGTVANATTTPAISIGTTITGLIKGVAGAIAAAIPGTDYVVPSGSITGNAGTATALAGGLTGNVVYQSAPSTSAFLVNGAAGTVLQSNGVGAAPSWVVASGATYTASDSIALTGSNFTLVNDSASPGASQYYGTNAGSTLGYFPLPASGSGTVTSFAFTNGGGFTGTVSNSTTTPTLSLVGALSGDITGSLTATALTATTNSTITTLSALSLPGSQVSSAVSLATNLVGGVIGDVPVQTAANTTSYIAPGTSGFVLTSNGAGVLPTYQASSGASYTASDSITLTGSNFTLKNDSASPAASSYYGTDGSSVLGYHLLGTTTNNYWTLSGSDIVNNNGGDVNINAPSGDVANVNIGSPAANFTSPGLALVGSTSNQSFQMGFNDGTPYAGYLQAYGAGGAVAPILLQPQGGAGANVGIGMTGIPAALLEVNGASQFDGTLTMSSSNAIVGNFINLNAPTSTTAPLSIGSPAANYTSPAIRLVGSTSNQHFDLGFNDGGIYAGYFQAFGAGGVAAPVLLNPTNGAGVGIGISTTPAALLEVGGSSQFDGTLTMSGSNSIVGTTVNLNAPTATTALINLGSPAANYTNPAIELFGSTNDQNLRIGYNDGTPYAGYIDTFGAGGAVATLQMNRTGGNVVIGGGSSTGDETLTVIGNIGPESAAPTASSCGGGSIVAGSSNNKGQVSGITAAAACTITFSSAITTTPACVFSSSTLGLVPTISSISTAAVTTQMSALTGTLYYICF